VIRDVTGRWTRMRRRFGIAAPRVAIHSQVPWYWRWAGIAVLLGISAASAAWIYDSGRQLAGFDYGELRDKLYRTEAELDEAREELGRVRALANAADSRLAIERTAQQKLAQQVRALEQENAKVREELATLESMLSSEARGAKVLAIHQFKVEPDVLPGEYRYHVLLVGPTARRERDFTGRLELVVNLQEGGRNAKMSFPEPKDAGAAAFRLAFRYFRRVEGTFRVSPKAKVETVQVRVFETGSSEPRATMAVAL
jgi:hypothetical protein